MRNDKSVKDRVSHKNIIKQTITQKGQFGGIEINWNDAKLARVAKRYFGADAMAMV